MTKQELSEIMSTEELLELLRQSATPIDFDALIAAGVLTKHGAWYQIHKMDELPEHARRKIYALRSGPPSMVKFRQATKSAARLYEKAMKNESPRED